MIFRPLESPILGLLFNVALIIFDCVVVTQNLVKVRLALVR